MGCQRNSSPLPPQRSHKAILLLKKRPIHILVEKFNTVLCIDFHFLIDLQTFHIEGVSPDWKEELGAQDRGASTIHPREL